MALEMLLCLCGPVAGAFDVLTSGVLSEGGGGRPGVGVASRGMLVLGVLMLGGGSVELDTDVDIDGLVTEFRDVSRLVVGDGNEVSFELLLVRRGLGAAETAGLPCKLKMPSRPIFAGVEYGGLNHCRRNVS
jgi:hypothetical protein